MIFSVLLQKKDCNTSAVFFKNRGVRPDRKGFPFRQFKAVHQQDPGSDQIQVPVTRQALDAVESGRLDRDITARAPDLLGRPVIVNQNKAAVLITPSGP